MFPQTKQYAFSLVEVMIAIGIFFMVAFSVLALVSQCLHQAQALEQVRTPLGSLASQTVLTNQLEEGFESGDFGDIFPDYRWKRDVHEAGTNGLYEVVLTVSKSGQTTRDSELTLLMYRPTSQARRPGRPARPGGPGGRGRVRR
jgi:hypothetical protein